VGEDEFQREFERKLLESPWARWDEGSETIRFARTEKIVYRGPGRYFMVGRFPDGTVVELRLMPYDMRLHAD
jgi:hypothetical protein